MDLTFGIKNGEVIHVSQVERGLSCGCVCPVCNYQLVAKKGEIKQHHFSHHKGSECNLETAIHLMAKKIIKDAGEIYLPNTVISLRDLYSNRGSMKLSSGKVIKLDNIEDEKYMDNITPDIIGYYNGTPLLIEIYVTHKTDDIKIDKIKSLSRSAIEIDLSNINYDTGIEELKQLVLYDEENRYWLNNNRANIIKLQLIASAELREIVNRMPHGSIVFHCPISTQIWNGRPYAHYGECIYCEHCLGQKFRHDDESSNILCIAK